ncbi:MAG TPA: hypothetical protein VGH81_07460 [Rudaea sp.]|jgi:hypothetical protein
MLRSQAILAVALLFAAGCSAACAGDFMPRAANGLAAVADDHAARSTSADAGPTAVMSEPDATPVARAAPVPATTTAVRRAVHVGADDVAVDAHAPAAVDDDKGAGSGSAPAHKSRAALRWQSLLPGVMK